MMLKSPTTKTTASIPSTSCPLSWKWCWRRCWSRPPPRPRPISIPQVVLCQLRHRYRSSCLFSSFHRETEQTWYWSFNSDCNVSSLSWAMPYFDCITFIFPLRLQGFNFGPGEITWGQFCKSLQENPFYVSPFPCLLPSVNNRQKPVWPACSVLLFVLNK